MSIIRCVVCGRQAIKEPTCGNENHITTLIGARAGFKPDECYCGHCAKDMDEDGLFPEERAQLEDLDDAELPGMWEKADFTGGETDR